MENENPTSVKVVKITKRDKIIDAAFFCMPASTHKEIWLRVVERTGDSSIKLANYLAAIAYLRKHPDKYYWTIAHTKRGKPGTTGQGRYDIVMMDASGRPMINESHLVHIEDGAKSTLREAATKSANQARALEAIARLTES